MSGSRLKALCETAFRKTRTHFIPTKHAFHDPITFSQASCEKHLKTLRIKPSTRSSPWQQPCVFCADFTLCSPFFLTSSISESGGNPQTRLMSYEIFMSDRSFPQSLTRPLFSATPSFSGLYQQIRVILVLIKISWQIKCVHTHTVFGLKPSAAACYPGEMKV